MGQLRAVILDVDGTFIDSGEAHALSWTRALEERGLVLPLATMRRMIGMGADQLLTVVADIERDTPLGAAISARSAAIFEREYLSRLRPFPGAHELGARLRRDGLRLVIANSWPPAQLSRLLGIAGIAELIGATIAAGDAARGKPQPDSVRAALARAGIRPEETILLGATPYDIEAAAKAGVGMIALRCGGWGDADLVGALALYDDPRELLACYDESPLALRRADAIQHDDRSRARSRVPRGDSRRRVARR